MFYTLREYTIHLQSNSPDYTRFCNYITQKMSSECAFTALLQFLAGLLSNVYRCVMLLYRFYNRCQRLIPLLFFLNLFFVSRAYYNEQQFYWNIYLLQCRRRRLTIYICTYLRAMYTNKRV